MSNIALVAHDACKERMTDWVGSHLDKLAKYPLVSTGTTGERIVMAHPSLSIKRVKSGPLGGDQQIGAMIAEGGLEALIFFIDPLSAMPHDVDVKALTRLAVHYDVPFACNQATADAVISFLEQQTQRGKPFGER